MKEVKENSKSVQLHLATPHLSRRMETLIMISLTRIINDRLLHEVY